MPETPHLYHFSPVEFRRPHRRGEPEEQWLPHMDPRLLVLLDALRNYIDRPITISPAPGAIGRRRAEAMTQHNVDRWGEVRAVDVMLDWLTSRDRVVETVRAAARIGFTGIGIYPDWSPSPGIHLDTRRDRRPGDAALWGGVQTRGRQVYVAYRQALMEWDT